MPMQRHSIQDSMTAALERLVRAQRAADSPQLQASLTALRRWQAARLAADYADQACRPRRTAAVAFFLGDVYGARDFSARDAQFARALKHLRRMLPLPALEALADAIELQALTAELDNAVAARLASAEDSAGGGEPPLTVAGYAQAYRDAGTVDARRRQIDLAVAIGRRLQEVVHFPGIEYALRLAATPARLAGYGDLQSFLERGFEAFRALGPEAREFVETIGERERVFMGRLLATPCGDAPPAEAEVVEAELRT
jgi:hypothetical protein